MHVAEVTHGGPRPPPRIYACRGGSASALCVPAIALAADRLDQRRLRRLRLDLAAQADDVDVDRARLDVRVAVVPDVEEQVLARDHPVAVAHQVLEDVALAGSERQDLALAMDLEAREVDLDPARKGEL